jgi:hypothetical protein
MTEKPKAQMTDRTNGNDSPQSQLYAPLVRQRRLISQFTLGVLLVAAIVGALYFWLQPTTWSATLGFAPVFEGASAGRYPNGLPFAASDIVNSTIVDEVVQKNGIAEWCPADKFLSALVVQESSPDLQFLNAEFQARLSDVRLTAVDRQRAQEEYAARRGALRPQYQLHFYRPQACAGLQPQLVYKALVEIIENWASASEAKRGVLKVRVSMLTTSIFDTDGAKDEPLFVRADMVRTAILRVVSNITQVQDIPGAQLVRVGEDQVSLAEVRARLEDLVQARLDPLIHSAGRGWGPQSARWVEQALERSMARLRAAEQRAEAYRHALREYSGMTTAPPRPEAAQGTERPNARDVQALTPQIDRTFVESIVELSATNTAFRQEITRDLIEESVQAVETSLAVEHYRSLLESMKQPGDSVPADVVSRRLDGIVAEAKRATQRFVDIYDEFSRVSLRVGPMMYRIEAPPAASQLRRFGPLDYIALLIAATVLGAIAISVVLLARHHGRRFIARVDSRA